MEQPWYKQRKMLILVAVITVIAIVIIVVSIVIVVMFVLKEAAVKSGGPDFQTDCLKSHNHYRPLHKSPLMELDAELSKYALEWAHELITKDEVTERPQTKYGENIYSSLGTNDIPCEDAVAAWYNEWKQYEYKSAHFSIETGHFSQMIWKDSKKLGCGFVEDVKAKKVIIVCYYDPKGNVVDKFVDNVSPPDVQPSSK